MKLARAAKAAAKRASVATSPCVAKPTRVAKPIRVAKPTRVAKRDRGAGASALETIASTVQRLAVLLSAGVSPASAWGYLGGVGDSDAGHTLDEIAAQVRGGTAIDRAIVAAAQGASEEMIWRCIAAAWRVATVAGASLAPTLNDLAAALRDLAQTNREVQTALAAPAATAKLVMMLPIIGVLFGVLLGYDTVGTLFASPLGWGCLIGGAALMFAARGWNRRLIAVAEVRRSAPGLKLDLVAIAVSGGGPIDRATIAVDEAWRHCGLDAAEGDAAIDDVLALSKRAGIPAAALLRTEADEVRRRARSEGARMAATLSVKLMLPLGLCILPAFMLVGVAPLLMSVISSTVAAF